MQEEEDNAALKVLKPKRVPLILKVEDYLTLQDPEAIKRAKENFHIQGMEPKGKVNEVLEAFTRDLAFSTTDVFEGKRCRLGV